MARIRRPAGPLWPAWFFSPSGDSAIFEKAADVPAGWVDRQHEVHVTPEPLAVDVEDTIKQLNDLGVWIDPTWGAAHLKKVLDDRSSSR
jgi:hypothetical protein